MQLHVAGGLGGADSILDGGTSGLEIGTADLDVLLHVSGGPETGGGLGLFAVKDIVSEGLVSGQVDGELTFLLTEAEKCFTLGLVIWNG